MRHFGASPPRAAGPCWTSTSSCCRRPRAPCPPPRWPSRSRSASGPPLAAVLPEEARPRLAALGFRPEDVEVLAGHFLAAERKGALGHGLARIEWLETWEELDTGARPRRLVAEEGYELWDGCGALGYLTLAAV